MEHSQSELAANAARFRGPLECYDHFRPAPPAILSCMIQQFAAIASPALVVDLGSGTGLSTRFWSQRSGQVIGIEPSLDMLTVAQAQTNAPNTSYLNRFSHQTGLADACADVVTCCQSLHWMDPERTIAEVARVLRAGGVWAVVDYDMPLIHWELDLAVRHCLDRAKATSAELELNKEQKHWPGEPAERIEKSARFRCVVESGMQAADTGDSTRLLGLVRSLGAVSAPLQACQSEAALGLDKLGEVSRRILDGKCMDWFWNYRVILALK